jgi:diguanylate cyclase (GGDEF)-like protein/PAS domain S-box-containing protein
MDLQPSENEKNKTETDDFRSLLELVPLEELQLLQDTLAEINGVTFVITDPNGNLLTMPSNEMPLCRLIRRSERGEAACLAHMRSISVQIQQEKRQICQVCGPLGFLNAAVPIVVNDTQLANLWVRQQCASGVSREQLRSLASFSGVDIHDLEMQMNALAPCHHENFKKILGWLDILAKKITQLGWRSLILSRNAEKLHGLERELEKHKSRIDILVQERTADLLQANKSLQLEVLERNLAEEQIERKSKLLDAINQVLRQTLSEHNETDLARTLLGAALRITAASSGFILQEKNNRWDIVARTPLQTPAYGPPTAMRPEPFDVSGVWREVIDEGRPRTINTASIRLNCPSLSGGYLLLKTLLIVPLMKDNRPSGLLVLANNANGFTLIDQNDAMALGQAFMGALVRKRLEQAKYQSEKRLNLAMDSANQGLWDYFPQTHHLYFSPSWFTMLGYDPHEFPTSMETWTTLTHPDDVPLLENALESVARGDCKVFGIEIRMLAKKGRWLWISTGGHAVELDDNGAVFRIVGTLSDISKYKRVELALQKANEELQRLAALDDLTEIANRRRFDDRLNQEWRRARRDGKPLAVIICDIDFFKNYNDTYGHIKGDDTLHAVAQAISGTLKRPMDLVARYGGEEFAAILPNTDINGAMRVAHEFKAAVDTLKIEHMASAVSDFITLSFGVAAMILTGEKKPKTLIEAADKALYKAKALGRNTIVRIIGKAAATGERSGEAA